jgi:hypothetical protein
MTATNFFEKFQDVVSQQVALFPQNRLIRKLEAGMLTMPDYHCLLTTLFHQTYSGPYSFARAAVNCGWQHEVAKEYLLQHAEEERSHWRWVLDDLKATGYCGENPRNAPPHPTCLAFTGLQLHVAEYLPVARLAVAATLEGIGATHGGSYGRMLAQHLRLTPAQTTFFLSHGETDKTHIVELSDVIGRCELSPEEWRWMHYAAETAGVFYRAMYDHDGYA